MRSEASPLRVFISYSHDSLGHADRVLALADRLRQDGIDSILDQYLLGSPDEGWPLWMDRQIRDTDFVLMICTPTYYRRVMGEEEPGVGHGVNWESNLVYQHFYQDATINKRFLPILLEGGSASDIPVPFRGVAYYRSMTEEGYEALYRRLTNQPLTPPPDIGTPKKLPPRERPPCAFGNTRTDDTQQVILSAGTNQEGSSVPAQTSLVGISSHIGRSHQHPLLGRDRERGVLRHFLFETEQCGNALVADHATLHLSEHRPSRSLFIVLHGDAGIGKTRLAEEVGRETQNRGWTVLWSQSYAQEIPLPYRLWIEVVRQAMNQGVFPYQEMGQHPRLYQPLSTLLPELAEMLPQDAAVSAVVPEQGQLRLWEAVLAVLGAFSRRTPLLLVLDDLHWADTSSQQLLAYLARRLHSYPILLLGTYRESEVLATHPLRLLLTTLQREQVISMLTVPPLADTHMGTLLSHLPKPLVQRIQRQAAGNPFFAEELARVASAEEPLAQTLPATITAVLDLRLGMLSHDCQQLLGKAAVLGNSFSFQQISMLEASNLTSLEEERVLTLLEEALRGNILSEEGTRTHITYTFWHQLLVNHLYDQLSATRRARLHRRAAEVLQRDYAGREEEGAAMITNHLVAGDGEPLQVVHYAELAGNRAYNLSAYPEAEGFYRIAVGQLDEHIGPFLVNASQDERSRLAYFLERLGECTRVQGNDEEARHFYERVLEVRSYQHTYATDDEYRYEAQIDALLWREIALTWYDLSDSEQAQKCCERGEKVLNDAGIVGGAAWAILHFQEGYIDWREGNYDSAYKFALEALELFKGSFKQQNIQEGGALRLTGTRRSLAGDPVNLGRAHTLLGLIANSVGEQRVSLDHLQTALTIFEQYNRQREIANVCCNLSDLYLKKAEHGLAQANLRRSLSLAEQIGDVPLMSVDYYNLGELAIRLGNLEEAETCFRQSLSLAEQINDQTYVSLFNVGLATVCQIQGKLSEAQACILRALTIGRAMRNAPCVGSALVALGNYRTAQAMEASDERDIDEENSTLHQKGWQGSNDTRIRLLRRAKMTLERALAFNELEAETKAEGRLALAYVLLLLDELDTACYYTIRILEEARQYELIGTCARCQRLLGSILTAQGKQALTEQEFEQAMQVFRKCGMRLEYARTLHSYSVSLLEHKNTVQQSYQEGLSFLREARQVFDECHAALDLQRVERDIAFYTVSWKE